MKVAIMSFPNSPSHGASLQMYALYEAICKKGHEAEILNYIPERLYGQYKHRNLSLKGKIRVLCMNAVSSIILPSSKKAFKKFEKKMPKYPYNILTDKMKLSEIANRYDRIIVGSDQVWNPDITYHDFSFYLDFCADDYKKASYAPSFGNDDVYMDEKERVSELLSKFTYLSAREKRGSEIIMELTGKTAPMVCDPTFLLSTNEWKEIAVYPKKEYGKYVLFYTVKASPDLRIKAENFAKAHGMKLVTIGGRMREKYMHDKNPVFGVGPAEFLGLIDGASYVFTNSFHGTALSVILQKNFWVEYSSNTNVRLINLINLCGLQECVIKEDFNMKETVEIDYSDVNKRLKSLIQSSNEYLGKILSIENE